MILVTGGNGFIGKVVCELLVSKGFNVLNVNRTLNVNDKYNSVACNITDKKELASLFKDYPVEYVVHLASMLVSSSNDDPMAAVRTNIIGSMNLLELSIEHKIKHFIYGSSLNIYGTKNDKTIKFKEDSLLTPSEFYGKTKWFVENLCRELSNKHLLKTTSVRIPIVVGPGIPSATSGWRTEIFNLINSTGKIFIPFDANESIPLAHVNDVAEEIVTLLFKSTLPYIAYNLSCETWKVETLKNFLEKLNSSLHIKTGNRELEGMPYNIDSSLIKAEINLKTKPLKERFVK